MFGIQRLGGKVDTEDAPRGTGEGKPSDGRAKWPWVQGPLGPFLLKHGLLAALSNLAWLWTWLGWTAFLMGWLILMSAQVLIRFIVRRRAKGHDSQSADNRP